MIPIEIHRDMERERHTRYLIGTNTYESSLVHSVYQEHELERERNVRFARVFSSNVKHSGSSPRERLVILLVRGRDSPTTSHDHRLTQMVLPLPISSLDTLFYGGGSHSRLVVMYNPIGGIRGENGTLMVR